MSSSEVRIWSREDSCIIPLTILLLLIGDIPHDVKQSIYSFWFDTILSVVSSWSTDCWIYSANIWKIKNTQTTNWPVLPELISERNVHDTLSLAHASTDFSSICKNPKFWIRDNVSRTFSLHSSKVLPFRGESSVEAILICPRSRKEENPGVVYWSVLTSMHCIRPGVWESVQTVVTRYAVSVK